MANYYLSNGGGERQGPFREEDLLRNGMTPDSLVWCNGMPGWQRASEVPELAQYFVSQPIVPPIQQQYPRYPQYPQAPQYSQGQYGYNQEPGIQPPKPDSNLVWAILSTVFCCLPLGIVAIIKASKVDSLYFNGDYNGAKEAAEDAKKWSIWSAVASVVFSILYGLFIFEFATGSHGIF